MVAPSQPAPLLVRADADAVMGSGHVMRCLALAQAWQEVGGQVTFAMATEAPALSQRLAKDGIEVRRITAIPGSPEDAALTGDLAQALAAEWIIIDGYHFNGEYPRGFRADGRKVLAVDDKGRSDHYFANVILNQNLGAEAGWYRYRAPTTQLLLGPRYALLRREFRQCPARPAKLPAVVRQVLVTFGGGDAENITLKAIQAFEVTPAQDLEVLVVVGPSNPHAAALEAAAHQARTPIQLVTNVHNMPVLMAEADIAISAAGGTCWELAFMGVPTITVVCADNQHGIATQLSHAGVSVNLGWHAQVTPLAISKALAATASLTTRTLMATKGRALVDGRGAERVMRYLLTWTDIALRPVVESDSRVLWAWANDAEVRAVSFSDAPISWDQHQQWFAAKLSNPACRHYIAQDDTHRPLGQIRFDIQGVEAVISISVDQHVRGRGYGSQLIQLGARQIFKSTPVQVLRAYVRPDNVASHRAFVKAGFTIQARTKLRGCEVDQFLLMRETANG